MYDPNEAARLKKGKSVLGLGATPDAGVIPITHNLNTYQPRDPYYNYQGVDDTSFRSNLQAKANELIQQAKAKSQRRISERAEMRTLGGRHHPGRADVGKFDKYKPSQGSMDRRA